MSREAAWRAHGFGSRNSTRFFKRPAIAARVDELREEFNEGSRISLAYLQERLLAFTTADVGNYLERRPYSDKLRVKDLTALPPELRACVSEVTIDKGGTLNFKLHDKTKAIDTLLKTLPGALAAGKVEVSGPGGAPLAMLIEHLLHPDNLAKLEDTEVETLRLIAHKIADDESPSAAPCA
jgi:Terminase small subunit